MTLLSTLRLALTGFTVAAVQILIVDSGDLTLLRHLDLPLAVAAALALTRPADAVVIGLVFGLAVDAFQLRLFGIHGLAYSLLGPVAAAVPVSGLRTRTELVAWLAAVQAVTATAVLLAATAIAAGSAPPGITGRFVQVTLWTIVVVVPLTAVLGGRKGLGSPGIGDRPAVPPSARWS